MNYEYKFNKYNNKVVKLLTQIGGSFNVTFDTLLTDKFDDLKCESVYSYAHVLNTTFFEDKCSSDVKGLACDVLTEVDLDFYCYPYATCAGKYTNYTISDIVKVTIIKDLKFNNIVVCFPTGSINICDVYTNELIDSFWYLYLYLRQIDTTTYKNIHMVGHSRGMSASILFTIFVFLLESGADMEEYAHMFEPSFESLKSTLKKQYLDKLEENLLFCFAFESTVVQDRDCTDGSFRKVIDDIKIFGSEMKNITANLVRKINECKSTLTKMSTLAIKDRVFICGGGGFPVIFDETSVRFFTKYKKFFNDRYIHFVNCNDTMCDMFSYNMVNNNTVTKLMTMHLVNINDFVTSTQSKILNVNVALVGDNGNEEYKDFYYSKSNLHQYSFYRDKLRSHITIS